MHSVRLQKTASTEADLYIYGSIGAEWFIDGITDKDVVEAITQADEHNVHRLNVRINSDGGEAFQGVAIKSVLDRAAQSIHVTVDGLAASAASVVAMAGETIEMAKGAMMMIHEAWGGRVGTADELRAKAAMLDSVTEQAAGIYAARSNEPISDIMAWMKQETWFDAAQAVEAGFADRVVEQELAAACWDLSNFRNPPTQLKSLVEKWTSAPVSPQTSSATPYRDRRELRVRLARATSSV